MLELITSHPKTIFDDASANPTGENILVVSESDITTQLAPNLSVDFSSAVILKLLEDDNCAGIRLYPGIEDDKLVMVAGMVDAFNNDFSLPHHVCGIGYSDGRISRDSNVTEGGTFILAENVTGPVKNDLNILQSAPDGQPDRVFKTFFSRQFLEGIFKNEDETKNEDSVRFEIAEFNYGAQGNRRTMVATTLNSTLNNELSASLLPCPPHCGGGGGYIG